MNVKKGRINPLGAATPPLKTGANPLAEDAQGTITFSTQVKKAIGILARAGKTREEIASSLSTMALLSTEGIPVSYEHFAQIMVRDNLSNDEVRLLYLAREAISGGIAVREAVRKCRKVRDPEGWKPSIPQLCGVYAFVGRDEELFESFVTYCRENMHDARRKKNEFTFSEDNFDAGFVQVFREWAQKNADSLPFKIPD